MPWYSWTFLGLAALYLLLALYAVGLLSWERYQERRIAKAVKRADGRWAAEHGIDLQAGFHVPRAEGRPARITVNGKEVSDGRA